MKDIKYTPNMDTNAPNIKDIVPADVIKVYPYEMPNSSNTKEFIGEQTTSIIYITQNNFVDNGLLQDNENSSKYFEMYSAINSDGQLDLSTSESTLGFQFKEEDNFISVSNWYYETKLDKIKIGDFKFIPAIFTIGEPFNRTKYENGEQPIFISSSMVEAKKGRSKNIINNLNPEGLYEYTMINISALESSFNNSKILFNNESNNLGNLKYVDDNGKTINGIQIGINADTLISKIYAKGVNGDNQETDVDFSVKGNFIPFKMTPISTQDKITMFSDWFDYDVTMPIYMANNFLNNKNQTFKKLITDTQSLYVLEDMMAVSYAFASQFADFYRYTQEDVAKDDKLTGSDVGKIKADITIGNSKIPVSALESKDPIMAVDSIFEKYIRQVSQDSVNLRDLKLYIVALSRYIYSSYAIGGGNNSYHRAYLPWYLVNGLTTAIQLVSNSDDTSYLLDQNIIFEIKSEWFEIEKNRITFKKDNDISNIKMIQTDRKLTIPELPYQIQPIDKLLLPADVDIKSSLSLAYVFYIPIINDDKLQKLFLPNATTITDNSGSKTLIAKYGPTLGGQPIDDIGKRIIEQAAKDQGLSTSANDLAKINYLGDGKIQTIKTAWQNWSQPNSFGGGWLIHFPKPLLENYIKWYKYWDQGLAESVIRHNYNDESTYRIGAFEEKDLRNQLDLLFPNSYDLQNVKISKYYDSFLGKNEETISSIEIRLYTFTAIGSYKVKGTSVTISADNRETLFDKVQWKDFLIGQQLYESGINLYQLNSTKEHDITAINEIIIYQLWGSSLKIYIGNVVFDVELFNSTDETLGVQRIIFS